MAADEDLLTRLRDDPCADHLALTLAQVNDGYARVEMEASEELCGFGGFLQNGIIAALAHYALSAASHSRGGASLDLGLVLSYIARVPVGRQLVAEATEEKLGRRIGVYRLVVQSAEGELVATGQATTYRLDNPGQ